MLAKVSDRDNAGFLNKYRSARDAGISMVSGALVDLAVADNTLVDVSGNNYRLTLNDGSAAVVDGISAWYFAGGSVCILPEADEFAFGEAPFTIEAKVYPTTDTRQCIFAYQNDGIFALPFSYEGDGVVGCFCRDSWYNQPFQAVLPLNRWTHLKFVRNGNKISCIMDGVSAGNITLDTDFIGETDQYVSFGRWGNDPGDFRQRWQGYMAEMRIWQGVK